MKTPALSLLAAAAMCSLTFTATAVPPPIDTVNKATASFPGFILTQDAFFNDILKPTTLTTNNLINLAMGRGLKDKVPKEQILAIASNDFALRNANTETPINLVVFDTTTKAILATIIVFDTTTIQFGENHIISTFKRVGFGDAAVQTVGNATNGISGGIMNLSCTLTRTRTPIRPIPKVAIGLVGDFDILRIAGVEKQFITIKGKISITGKPIDLP